MILKMEFENTSKLFVHTDTNTNTNLTNFTILDVYETIIASVLTLLTILSCVSNFIIIIVFLKFKCLRTKHDMLVLNLAFTNLVITVGISFYSSFTLNPGDILHMEIVCMNLFVFIFGGILSSLLVLLYLALERYIYIVHPLFHSRIKIRHVVWFSILAYVIGTAYALVPFVLKNKWSDHHVCVADVYPFEFSFAEQILGIVIISVIIVINIIVFKTAISQAARINTLLKNIRTKKKSQRRMLQRGKAFVTVFLVSGVSVICWIPLLIVLGLEANPDLNEPLRWIFTQLSYIPVSVNSCVTAVIIGHRNRHFKDAIKAMCCKKRHECIKNSTAWSFPEDNA